MGIAYLQQTGELRIAVWDPLAVLVGPVTQHRNDASESEERLVDVFTLTLTAVSCLSSAISCLRTPDWVGETRSSASAVESWT